MTNIDLKKTGTMLHESAAAHSEQLSGVVSRYEVEDRKLQGFFEEGIGRVPNVNIVHSDPTSTHVVDMFLERGQIDSLIWEFNARDKIARALKSSSVGTYSPVSLEFENSILFSPSAHRFYAQNKDAVYSLYPDIHTIVVNAFFVPAGKRPYGSHNAGSIAFQRPDLCQDGHGYPQRHISFHTALTPTPLERQPLVVFDDARVESPSTGYLYERLQEYPLQEDELQAIRKGLYVLETGIAHEMDIVSLRDFLLCKYWEKTYEQLADQSAGYFADLSAGQAIVFDNYRPHADSTLPLSTANRITIDMRCFSRVTYPTDRIKSGLDLYSFSAKKKLEEKRQLMDGLLSLLGYRDCDDFLATVYGKRAGRINLFETLTDLQFGIYNRTPDYLLDQNLDHHYERVQKLYERIEKDGEFVVPSTVREVLL